MGAAPGGALSAASVNRDVALLKATFNRAMSADPPKADRNPARGVKLLKRPTSGCRVLTDAEAGRLRVALPDYLHPFVVAPGPMSTDAAPQLGQSWVKTTGAASGVAIPTTRSKN